MLQQSIEMNKVIESKSFVALPGIVSPTGATREKLGLLSIVVIGVPREEA